MCGGATGEASRSRASSVSSRRVTCAPCALLSAAHDTEPIFGSQPRAMRERTAGLKGGRCHRKHDLPSCFALGARFSWLRGCGRDLKQNRERRRIRLFLYVAGRKARYERDAQAHIRSHSNARSTSLPSSDARAPLSHHARSRLRVVSRAQKRAGGADDATRRNRRRTRTTHLAGYPAASNGALI